MITAEDLASCSGMDGVARLFEQLGYPVASLPIDPEVWVPSDGQPPELHHFCRTAGVDLFAVSGTRALLEQWSAKFLERHGRRNALLRPVIAVQEEGSATLSLLAHGARGSLRRLDVDLARPRPDALDRLNSMRIIGAPAGDHRRVIERVFDRESVGRSFFTRFRRSVVRVGDALRSGTGAGEDDVAAQSLLIHARLLFLYFIQQKGWLNGEARYLASRVDACRDGLWRSFLAPLFFGCLNTPGEARSSAARSLGAIPYLNGGLFERNAFEKRFSKTGVPDAVLREAIDGVFERYSFSIDEEDRSGIHVDPEMLGRVFESLMEADDRATSGSFYTPRPIVDVLTRRAIVTWCARGDQAAARALESLVRGEEASIGPAAATLLLRRLERITVLDPACGSGAFLLAALHLIERLVHALSAIAGSAVPAELRRRIVENSLFGVDLKQEAVHLCELRLWLAIVAVSREQNVEDVPPLPNLDRNVLQGNSLLAPVDFLSSGRRDIYAAWRRALRGKSELVDRYRHASPVEKPKLYRALRALDRRLAAGLLEEAIASDEKELRNEQQRGDDLFGQPLAPDRATVDSLEKRIAAARAQLRRLARGAVDFFAYEVHFGHVLASGGFDVILGNPPWVRGARIDAASRKLLADRYPAFAGRKRRGFEQSDLSIAFAERALSLLAPGGAMALLLPSKILNAGYAAPLRERLARTGEIVAIDDWSDSARRLFDADTFPLGLTVRRAAPNGSVVVTRDGESLVLTRDQLEQGHVWTLDPPEIASVFRRLRGSCATLRSLLRRMPLMGVKSGANRLFFRDDVVIEEGRVRLAGPGLDVPPSAVCRVIRGRDVTRWVAADSTWMIWPPPPRQAEAWADDLARRLGVQRRQLRLAYVRPEHLGVKVVWKDVSRGMQAAAAPAAVVREGVEFRLVPNQTVYSIDAADTDEARVIAAIMNSSVFGALAVSVAERAKDRHFRYFAATLAELPFPRVDRGEAAWHELAHLGRRGAAGGDVEREVNMLAASLYGISADEAGRLERYLASRLGR